MGLLVLRMLVTGALPNWAAPGIPQSIIVSSRLPSSAYRTTGTIVSGKMLGSGGKLPVVSLFARLKPRMARWLLVML